MFKKSIFIFLLVTSVVCYVILQKYDKSIFKNNMAFLDLHDREKVEIIFNSDQAWDNQPQPILVEVVKTAQSTTLGLSGRDEIGSNGMLFIFPTSENRYFWMKDMKFDIDIIWISDNQVVSITKNVPKPEPNTSDNRLETYSPDKNVDMVLELNAGDSEKYKINPGDVVQLVK